MSVKDQSRFIMSFLIIFLGRIGKTQTFFFFFLFLCVFLLMHKSTGYRILLSVSLGNVL